MGENYSNENRLSEEKSPYLQQHAKDPVNWQPWDEKALKSAREREVPIFLSVGYSACHWCHVMQKESFRDEEGASILNKSFVPIKVDREERPDIDQIYQEICQKVTGGGGWPLSAWLTPEGEPFYIGTYLPRNPKYGRKGFVEVLREIENMWEVDRGELVERAQRWTDALNMAPGRELWSEKESPEGDPLVEAADRIFEIADVENGGFGTSGPKFPHPLGIEVLMNAYFLTGRSEFEKVAFKTLDSMMKGGIHDHIGGGFHRYSTDPKWEIPHFEKMLYDNALIPLIYFHAYQMTGEKDYFKTVESTLDFLESEMRHPDGGFYSSQSAQSEGAEGKFYVWSLQEVREAIEDSETADIFVDRFGVSERGNFDGKNVLAISKNLDELAEKYGLGEGELEMVLKEAMERVMNAREKRSRPPRDEKILAGWNGLAISALARSSPILGKCYEESAESALDFVKDVLWDGEGKKLFRRYKDGESSVYGFLEDYAYLAQGSFDLYQVNGKVEHLKFSLDLCRSIRDKFWDEDAESLYFTPDDVDEELIVRPQQLTDLSTPSGTGSSARILSTLSHLFPGEGFEEIVDGVLAAGRREMRKSPLGHCSLVLAEDQHRRGLLEVTIVADRVPDEWNFKLAEKFVPNGARFPRPISDDEMEEWLVRLGVSEVPGVWKNREAEGSEETLYICGGGACSPPVKDIDEGIGWIEKLNLNRIRSE